MLESLVKSGSGGYFGVCTRAALKVRFWNNAPRASKSSNRCRCSWADAVRRRRADRAVLSAPWVAGRLGTADPISPAKQPVQHQRVLRIVALPAGARSGTDRNDRAPADQWRVSLLGRLAGLPRRHHLAPIPRAVRSRGTKFLGQIARHLAGSDARAARPGGLRFGQHGADRLWPSGTSRGGLQP